MGTGGSTTGRTRELVFPGSQNSAKIVKENVLKLVGYAFRLEKRLKSPPPPTSFRFFRAGATTDAYILHLR